MNPVSGQVQHDLTQENIQRLKDKFSQEMRDDVNNPVKVCIRLIFEAATEKNLTKRLELSKNLSKFLTEPDGVISLFLALVDFDTSSQKVTTHNQRFIAVANIITCLPELCMPYAEYCKIIFDQLKSLLLSENKQYSTLASIIVKSILESKHAHGHNIERIIFDPIFKPFAELNSQFKPHQAIIIIYNLLQNHVSPSLSVEIFPELFYALHLLKTTPSRLKSFLKQSIIIILNDLKAGAACCLIEKTLFHCRHLQGFYSISAEEEDISIKITETDVVDCASQEISASLKDLVLSVLSDSDNELLILEFFFHFKETMLFAKKDRDRELSMALVESLLEQTIEEEQGKIDLMSIVAKNGKRSLELISRVLLNYVSHLRSKQDSSTMNVISQSILSCCSILDVLSVISPGDEEQELVQRKCLPVLKELSELLVTQEDPDQQRRELHLTITSLMKRLNGIGFDVHLVGSGRGLNTHRDSIKSEFDTITKDLNDKLVPVRVHAMVRLRQMIIANEQYAVKQIPELYRLTLCFLGDAEPYAFLACINLMAEMAMRRTDTILPKLCDLYSDSNLDLQQRLNIGEVLVRLFKQLNATAPHYAQQVMNVLCSGCRDTEELIRMSSLTNIGELCRSLNESLWKYLTEILVIIESILNTDTLEVKCAALDLLRTLLSGLQASDVESVQRDLKSIYRLLKRVSRGQRDAKLSLQLELALDEISRLASGMLEPEETGESLVKNIKLLSLLPNRWSQ